MDVEWARVVTKADNVRYPAFAVDEIGEVYLAGLGIGIFDLGGGPDGERGEVRHFVVRYSRDGDYRWHRSFETGGPGVHWTMEVNAVAGIVAALTLQNPADFGGGQRGGGACPTCASLVVLGLATSDGAYRWDWEATGGGDNGIWPFYPGLALVGDGDVAVAANAQGVLQLGGAHHDPGPFTGPGDVAPFLALARPDGSTRWIRLLAPMTRPGWSVEAVPPSDLLWLLTFQGELDLGEDVLRAEHENEMALVRYGLDGSFVRAQRTNGGVFSVAPRADGSIAVTGGLNGPLEVDGRQVAEATAGAAFVLSLDRAGDVEWVRIMENGPRLFAATAADGSVVLAGYQTGGPFVFGDREIPGPMGRHDIVVASYDRVGNPRWAHSVPAPGAQQVHAVEATADGGIVIMGVFEEQWSLGDFVLRPSPIPEAAGYDDVFIARLHVGR